MPNGHMKCAWLGAVALGNILLLAENFILYYTLYYINNIHIISVKYFHKEMNNDKI